MDIKKLRDTLLEKIDKLNRKDISGSHAYISYSEENTDSLTIIGFSTLNELKSDIDMIQEVHGDLPDSIMVCLYAGNDRDGYLRDFFCIRLDEA